MTCVSPAKQKEAAERRVHRDFSPPCSFPIPLIVKLWKVCRWLFSSSPPSHISSPEWLAGTHFDSRTKTRNSTPLPVLFAHVMGINPSQSGGCHPAGCLWVSNMLQLISFLPYISQQHWNKHRFVPVNIFVLCTVPTKWLRFCNRPTVWNYIFVLFTNDLKASMLWHFFPPDNIKNSWMAFSWSYQ